MMTYPWWLLPYVRWFKRQGIEMRDYFAQWGRGLVESVKTWSPKYRRMLGRQELYAWKAMWKAEARDDLTDPNLPKITAKIKKKPVLNLGRRANGTRRKKRQPVADTGHATTEPGGQEEAQAA